MLSTTTSVSPKAPQLHQEPKRRWPKVLCIIIAVLIALCCLVYFAVPVAIHYIAVQQLEKKGMAQVKLEPIAWKPWVPSVTLSAIHWQTPSAQQVSLTSAEVILDWQTIVRRHVFIKTLRIAGLQLPVELQPQLSVAGIVLDTAAQQPAPEDTSTEKSPWHISLAELDISKTTFTVDGLPASEYLKSKSHSLSIQTLSVADFSTLSPETLSDLQLKGQFDDIAFELAAEAAVLSPTLALDTNLKLQPIDPFATAQSWLEPTVLNGVSGDGDLELHMGVDHKKTDTGRQIQFDFQLSSPALQTRLTKSLEQPIEVDIQDLALDIKATLHLAIPSFHLALTSQASFADLKAASGDISATIKTLNANVALKKTEGKITALEQLNPALDGEISVADLTIDSQKIQPALAFSQLQSKGSLQDKTVLIPSVSLTNLRILGATKPLMKNVVVSDMTFGRDEHGLQALNIDNVTIHDLAANLELTAKGTLSLSDKIQSIQEQVMAIIPKKEVEKIDVEKIDVEKVEVEKVDVEKVEVEKVDVEKVAVADTQQKPGRKTAAPPPLAWQINQIELQGQNSFQFIDNREGFGVTHHLTIDKLDMKKVGLSQPMLVDFKSALKSGGSLSTIGQVTLADLQAQTALKTTVENLSLPPFSPYVVPVLGYSVETGQLESTLELNATAGKGKSLITLEANKFNLNPANDDIIASLAKELTMPLDLSLSLLKDKNDTIKLEIPIDLDQKSFKTQIAPIIRQSLARATKNASVAYLKYALQPYGGLIILAEQSQKLINKMQLVDITFSQMSAALDDSQQKPMKKIAKLLQSKPKLQVQLCPTASKEEAKDWPTEPNTDLNLALKTLALQRAQSVKLFFKNYNISEKRLFVCAEAIVESGQGQVKISL